MAKLIIPALFITFLFFLTTLAYTVLDVDHIGIDNSSSVVRRQNEEGSLSWIKKFAAIGDSYAAGIGAGTRINYWCSRYDQSYPSLINEALGGQAEFEYQACSGAESPDILKSQVPLLSNGQDAITISSGGNDAKLKDLMNHCIYAWDRETEDISERIPRDCQTQINIVWPIIRETLPGNLDRLYSAVRGKLSEQGKVYVTGYGRFFDDTTVDCDSVSWHWWGVFGAPQYLTQARRQSMNQLADAVNDALRQAVQRQGDRFEFVEYDAFYGVCGGRFCSPGVNPQDKVKAANHHNLLFYLGETDDSEGATTLAARAPIGEGDPFRYPEHTFEGQIQQSVKHGYVGKDPLSPDFLNIPLTPDRWARVFHPNKQGHALIAAAVLFRMQVSKADPEIAEASPRMCEERHILSRDAAVQLSDDDLNGNFPSYFVLSDGGKYSLVDIGYRMRDKLCQGVCVGGTVEGVPASLAAATQFKNSDGSEGCEYVIKVAHNKEAYLYATETGENCYTGTELAITNRGKKRSAYVGGSNFAESYQVGIRDLNSPRPTSVSGTIGPFFDASKRNEHLGYLHLACRRSDGSQWQYNFNLRVSNWDDGNYGKSLDAEVAKCEKALGSNRWLYEPDANDYVYTSDGTKSENFAYWELAMTIPYRCGEKAIETVFGLVDGSVKCPSSEDFHEIDLLTTPGSPWARDEL